MRGKFVEKFNFAQKKSSVAKTDDNLENTYIVINSFNLPDFSHE
jgi:hypothetical protein